MRLKPTLRECTNYFCNVETRTICSLQKKEATKNGPHNNGPQPSRGATLGVTTYFLRHVMAIITNLFNTFFPSARLKRNIAE